MRQLRVALAAVALAAPFAVVSCGGASPEGETAAGGTETVSKPKFAGFNLSLEPGAYWEFAWDSTTMSAGLGGGGTSTEQGRFRIVLGDATKIEGKTLYGVDVEIVEGDKPTTFKPTSWEYVGVEGNTIIGSLDGENVRVIFDAQLGKQPGGGFLEEPYDQDQLLAVSKSTIDNAYLSGDALVLSSAAEEGGCETFPDVGTICAETSESFFRDDYFQPQIGPVGYYWQSSVSGATGGAGLQINIGLVEHSFEVAMPTETGSPIGPDTSEDVAISATPASVAPGETVTVTWEVRSDDDRTNDWIGLYAAGAPNTHIGLGWQYTDGASSGSLTFTAPRTAGTYEFRYLKNDGYTDAATSNAVIVP
ncbi:MAG: hypothetical protein ACRDUY_11015 [Nitriliruptorales bacterium]